jgi:hypothetical protein
MASGKAVTVDEIDATLGKEIHMYRLSTYIWLMKTNANAVVKAIKDGRKITAYQLMNVAEVKKYLDRNACWCNVWFHTWSITQRLSRLKPRLHRT